MKRTYEAQSELPITRKPRRQEQQTLDQIAALAELVDLHGDAAGG